MRSDKPVPGNRWDLLDAWPATDPAVSVVIVHYEQPQQLARTYWALSRQTLAPLEVIVVDDGSQVVPTVEPGGPPTQILTQPNLGFRAAAARNLGASHCRGDVIVFLDADTSPEPDCLRYLTRRVAQCRDVVAVGRRRHADFTGLSIDVVPVDAPRLTDPAWLRDGYTGSHDLLDADGRSFRYIISAVLACGRRLYEELGGFDERFVGYGGEDWDFAYRAWNAGAVFVHEADAVAWHDGPEWAGRDDRFGHDSQSLRLAALIPEPMTRGAPLPHALPDLLVDVEPEDQTRLGMVHCVHSVLRQGFADMQLRSDGTIDGLVAELYGDTLHTTPWTQDQVARARARLTVRQPLPEASLRAAMELLVAEDLGRVEIVAARRRPATLLSTRALARSRRWRDREAELLSDERWFRSSELQTPGTDSPPAGLGAFFARDR